MQTEIDYQCEFVCCTGRGFLAVERQCILIVWPKYNIASRRPFAAFNCVENAVLKHRACFIFYCIHEYDAGFTCALCFVFFKSMM